MSDEIKATRNNPRGRKPGGRKSGGRQKGSLNKHTRALKAMIEQALADSGGINYLKWAAKAEPAAFLSLLGKTLPKDLNLGAGVSLEVNLVSRQAQN